jgi:site-specific recombinase XerD
MALAAVRDLRELRAPSTLEELAAYEVDLLSEFVLARASAGVGDSTIQQDLRNLEQLRGWLDKPLWEMRPADADNYFGRVLRASRPGTRTKKAAALAVFFQFLGLRHKTEIYNLTGHVVECPLDELNRPRTSVDPQIRVPPSDTEIGTLFTGWRQEMATCRKFATVARNYAVARLITDVGLRINEVRMLDLTDVRWDLGRFGKLHVRHGKGSKRRGPKQRIVPLINGADATLRWFIQDVWGHFDEDHERPGAPLFPSERKNGDGTARRVGDNILRRSLIEATGRHLPAWAGRVTPHVLRHFCASQLYQSGMDLIAIQALMGHSWAATTQRYIHVQKTHIEDAWINGQQRAARRWEGLAR